MSLIIVRLNGGLGNQLFQYAAGFALSSINNSNLKIDISNFSVAQGCKTTLRTPDIQQFSLMASVASKLETDSIRNPLGYFSIFSRFFRQRICKQYYSDWHPEILSLKGDIYLDGYFQSDKYFSIFRNLILNEYRLKSELEVEIETLSRLIEEFGNTVSLHVRRGDYVSNRKVSKFHYICTVDYYNRALEEIKMRFDNFKLIVFSDDIKWVRENLNLGNNVFYLSGLKTSSGKIITAAQELILMSRCKHHIISNSTFSWWGAYLNDHKNKIVIAPNLWNRSKIDSHRNILPDSWLRIRLTEVE